MLQISTSICQSASTSWLHTVSSYQCWSHLKIETHKLYSLCLMDSKFEKKISKYEHLWILNGNLLNIFLLIKLLLLISWMFVLFYRIYWSQAEANVVEKHPLLNTGLFFISITVFIVCGFFLLWCFRFVSYYCVISEILYYVS